MSITLEQPLGQNAPGRAGAAAADGPDRADLEHPVHSAADRGHGHGVHRRCHGGPYRSFGTASIGIVSSSTWLLHGMLAGLYMSFAIQVAQYLGADRQEDARGVLRQSMLFNLFVGLAAAAFGIGISRYLPGWLGADPALQADASAYFAIWSAALPFTMATGTYSSMLRSTGDALTPGLISVATCLLDIVFNFFLINPTRTMVVAGRSFTVWGAGWGCRELLWAPP